MSAAAALVRPLRESSRRAPTERERIAAELYDRLHQPMAALGALFLVLVLAQRAAHEGTALHLALLVGVWVLWAAFAVEYLLRLVIAPSTLAFVRSTWWQLLFLIVPFLTMLRFFLVLRMARPARVALAAVRGSRSARATLGGRAAWLAVCTAIVTFAAADILYSTDAVRPYGRALHAAALAAVNGEPIDSDAPIAQVLDVVLALFALVFFASLAGILGVFFLERRDEQRGRVADEGPRAGDRRSEVEAAGGAMPTTHRR